MKGKTSSGFKFDVDESKIAEWEFLDILADAESADDAKKLIATRNLAKFLLGDEQLNKLLVHIKEKNNGKAGVKAVMDEVTAILNAIKAIKK